MKTGKLTADQWRARAEAWESAAGHLELDWTDDPVEREQGKVVARMCRLRCEESHRRAMDVESEGRS